MNLHLVTLLQHFMRYQYQGNIFLHEIVVGDEIRIIRMNQNPNNHEQPPMAKNACLNLQQEMWWRLYFWLLMVQDFKESSVNIERVNTLKPLCLSVKNNCPRKLPNGVILLYEIGRPYVVKIDQNLLGRINLQHLPYNPDLFPYECSCRYSCNDGGYIWTLGVYSQNGSANSHKNIFNKKSVD